MILVKILLSISGSIWPFLLLNQLKGYSNALTLTVDGEDKYFELFTNNYGQLVMVSDYGVEEETRLLSYPFVKKEPVQYKAEDLFGDWKSEMFVSPFSGSLTALSFTNESNMELIFTDGYSFSPSKAFHRINNDNSVSILKQHNCPQAITFAECEQQVLNTLSAGSEDLVNIRKMEFFKLSNDQFIAATTLWTSTGIPSELTARTIHQVFKRVDSARIK